MKPILYVVSTPIGNLEDITQRAIRILKEVDLILCEDKRVAKKLLNFYKIEKPLLSYHQHSKIEKTEEIINFLKEGKKVALISDAGTPGISDPGNKLIEKIVEIFKDDILIIPIPGPCALVAAASISGFPTDRFLFLGFLPKKKKRREFLRKIVYSEYPVIFYESPYRVIRTLKEINSLFLQVSENCGELKVVVCRELTKKFETIYRGNLLEVIEKLENSILKGEFTIIIWRPSGDSPQNFS